jgi:hypothetical protein
MKRIIALFLSILMLASTAGVSLATHYCKGKVYKSSICFISGNPLGCGMEKNTDSGTVNDNFSISSNCCKNHSQTLHVEDSYKTTSNAVNCHALFSMVYIFSYHQFALLVNSTFEKHKSYNPPLLNHDVPVMIQSFLI